MESIIIEAFVKKPTPAKTTAHQATVTKQLTSMSWNSIEVAQVQISAVENPSGFLGYQSSQDCGASFTTIQIPTFSNSKCMDVRERMQLDSFLCTINLCANVLDSSLSGVLVVDSFEWKSARIVPTFLDLQQRKLPLALPQQWYASLLN